MHHATLTLEVVALVSDTGVRAPSVYRLYRKFEVRRPSRSEDMQVNYVLLWILSVSCHNLQLPDWLRREVLNCGQQVTRHKRTWVIAAGQLFDNGYDTNAVVCSRTMHVAATSESQTEMCVNIVCFSYSSCID